MTTAALSLEIKTLPQINWKIICVFGFFVCLALLVFYVMQVGDLTRGTYLVQNYEKQIAELSSENKNLQVSFAENSFLEGAIQQAQSLNFQKVKNVRYVQVADGSVATIAK